MAERKNKNFDRPGGYATPTGGVHTQRDAVRLKGGEHVRLWGDGLPAFQAAGAEELTPESAPELTPAFTATDPQTRVFVGDCRDVLFNLKEKGAVDLIFADPPFNWDVPYPEWGDGMPRQQYERFTFDWLDGCIDALSPCGSLWVNIPDDTAAEIVIHVKRRGLTLINWCVWHFRFGQHRDNSFILSKAHALYFARDAKARTWNPDPILEPSDRASIYGDPRTMTKATNQGRRVPMDVWYGPYWGRVQGNNKERRNQHHNQIPEAYLERVILSCSNPGDLVLDPFLGSGTTGTVARTYGRRSIGIEFSRELAASAWERIMRGMVRPGAALGQPSAIHPNRRRKTDRNPEPSPEPNPEPDPEPDEAEPTRGEDQRAPMMSEPGSARAQ